MPVQIDMPLPTCCAECRLYVEDSDTWSRPGFCSAVSETEREWTKIAKDTDKPFWCPLQEVKE